MNLKSRIVLGNYIPKESIIHRIDSKIKLFLLLFILLAIYFINTLEMVLALLGILFFILWAARLPASLLVKSILPFIWLFLLTGIFNLFFTPGESIATIGPFGITLEGLRVCAVLILRLMIMVLSASLFTLTTSQSEIIKALDWFLNPLRKIGLPVKEFTLMSSLSLRFIPILLDEADRIFKAQTSKGAHIGGLTKRLRDLPLFLSPLFINTFRRADELATAMIARGYEEYKTHT